MLDFKINLQGVAKQAKIARKLDKERQVQQISLKNLLQILKNTF